MRFDFFNIFKQSVHDNQHLHANIPGYDLGLIDRYGKEFYEFVKFENPKLKRFKRSKIEILNLIPIARKELRELKKRSSFNALEERKRLNKIFSNIEG